MKRALALLCVFAVAAVLAEQWDTPAHIDDPLGDASVVPTGRLGTSNCSPIIYRAAEGWACLSSSNPLPVSATTTGSGGQ